MVLGISDTGSLKTDLEVKMVEKNSFFGQSIDLDISVS